MTTSHQTSSSPSRTEADRPHDLRVEFFSRPEYLAIIRQMVDALCARLGYPPADASRVCLAVDEALCNVIRHGYDSASDGPITLTIREIPTKGYIEFVIEDRARQVDLATIRSRDLEDVRPGGLGVHLIEEIMDHASWDHRDGGGMRLVMHRTLPATPTATSDLNTDHPA